MLFSFLIPMSRKMASFWTRSIVSTASSWMRPLHETDPAIGSLRTAAFGQTKRTFKSPNHLYSAAI
jgi:hypothetical protein